MKNRVYRLLMAALLIAGIAATGTAVFAQQSGESPKERVEKTKGQKGQVSDHDENIIVPRGPDDPEANIEAPPDKGGPKMRGGYCRVHVDNHTRYSIDIYIDGYYRGTASRFGDLIGPNGCGDHSFYGVATFRDGSTLTWGPSLYEVDGTFTWTVY